AVVLKMMLPLLQRRDVTGLVILAAVFVAIGLIRWPLQIVLLVAIPLSLAITIVTRRMVKS
ncbi:MAG: chromate transporter, partial [Bradyrhizobium sp.]